MAPADKLVPTGNGGWACPCGRPVPTTVLAQAKATARSRIGPCQSCSRYLDPRVTEQEKTVAQALFGPALFEKIAQETALVRFATHAQTWDRKIRKEKAKASVEVVATETNRTLDQDAIRLSTDLTKDRTILSLASARRAFVHEINRCSAPCAFLGDALRFVYFDKLPLIFEEERKLIAKNEQLLNELEGKYPSLREAAKERLGPLWRDDYFPPFSEIRLAYRVEPIQVLAQNVMIGGGAIDGRLALVDKVRYEAMVKQAKEDAEKTVASIRDGFRVQFATLCETLRDRIKTTLGQEGRQFRDANLDNVKEWLRDFRNLTDDAVLQGLVEKARAILDGASADDLRDTPSVAQAVEKTMADVATVMKSLGVAPKPTRKLGIKADED